VENKDTVLTPLRGPNATHTVPTSVKCEPLSPPSKQAPGQVRSAIAPVCSNSVLPQAPFLALSFYFPLSALSNPVDSGISTSLGRQSQMDGSLSAASPIPLCFCAKWESPTHFIILSVEGCDQARTKLTLSIGLHFIQPAAEHHHRNSHVLEQMLQKQRPCDIIALFFLPPQGRR
jgi:hypothetical protein